MLSIVYRTLFLLNLVLSIFSCAEDTVTEQLESRTADPVSNTDILLGLCPGIVDSFKKETNAGFHFTGIICVDEDKPCPDPTKINAGDFEPFMGTNSNDILKKYLKLKGLCTGECDRDSMCFIRLVKNNATTIKNHNVFDGKQNKEMKNSPLYCRSCEWTNDSIKNKDIDLILTVTDDLTEKQNQVLLFESIINKEAPWRARNKKMKCCGYKVTNLAITCDCDEWPKLVSR